MTSERASLTWGLAALNHASRARDLLLEAYKMDPKALDAGTPTSLGVLYYRVPGFRLAGAIRIRPANISKRPSKVLPMAGTRITSTPTFSSSKASTAKRNRC